MKPPRRGGARIGRAGWAIVTACALLLALGWMITLERIRYEGHEAQQAALRETRNLALAFEQDVIRTLQRLDTAMRFAEHEVLEEGSFVDLSTSFADMSIGDGPFTAVSIVDASGRVIVSTAATGADLSDRAWFRFHASDPSSALHVGPPVNGRISGRPTITVTRRIDRPDGTFGGAVIAGVVPSYFTDFFERIDIGSGGSIQLVGNDGVVRARRSGRQIAWGDDLSDSNLLRLAAAAHVGSFTSTGRQDGVSRFTSYRRIAGYPLLVSVGVSTEEAMASFLARQRGYYLGAAAATLILMVGAAMLLVVVGRHSRAVEGQRQADARFRDLVDNTSDFVWELDERMRFTYASRSLEALLGGAPEALLGRTPVEFMPEEDRARVLAETQALIAEGKPFTALEHRVLDAQGRRHVWEVSGVPVRGPGGALAGYRGISRDITSRKAAEGALRRSEEAAKHALARSKRHLEALDEIASATAPASGDMASLARRVTEAAARATGAARANLWLFNDDETELRCIDLYEAPQQRHSSGLVLTEAQFGNEFAALKGAPFVNADDPLTDPRTAGYVESYVKPLGITSMLDVVVAASGRCLGLLCIEHVGAPHHWEEDEIAFGCRMADKFAAAIASHEARESEERFRRYFELGLIGMAITDPARGFIEVNQRFAEMLGCGRDELLGRDWAALTHPADLALDLEQFRRVVAGEIDAYSLEKRFLRSDGRAVSAKIEVRCVRRADGAPDYFLCMAEDLTERKQASERIAATFHQAGVGIVTTTLDSRLLEVNDRFATMLGYQPQELIGRTLAELTHPHDLASGAAEGLGHAEGGLSGEVEQRLLAKDGRTVFVVVTAAVVRDASGDPDYLVGVVRDVTESKRIQEKLEYQSHYDALTGLPNRVLFMDRLGQTLSQAKRKQWSTGVLVLDLDRFKTVNESFGQEAGDEVLREAARRLQTCIRPGDTVARLSSDEFAVVLADLGQPRDAGAVAGKILGEITRTFAVRGEEVFMSASIGIATQPPDGADVDTLMRNAGAAMHKAKDSGRNNVQFYAAGMQAAAGERVALESDLRKAVERGELLLHYQPKLSLITGQVSGFEALMRWRNPSRGIVPPGRFIPVMEESGLIVQAGEWAVDAACAQIAAWRAAGLAPVPVAVNLSARQFLHHNLHAVIEAALSRHKVEPSLFEIEVTESDAMRNPQEVAAILGRMRARGHTIAVDDFGTGYSSLAYLKRLPLDTLKIDRSFITGLPSDLDDASIARAVIAMAHRLGLKVVAEGVETEEQRIFLTINKCDEMQGYLFSAPLPAEECAALLRKAGTSALMA